MASLKRCDACHEVWDPEEHRDPWDDHADRNLASLSLTAPAYRDKSIKWADRISEHYELCQQCAREVYDLLLSKKPK